ncbi:MAG: sensor histidine kinase [Ginsengibacter sp.]|jgi:signal transduction histidine kinase
MDIEKEPVFKNKTDINILVVDDREDNLLSIEAILQKDEYNIIKANSGRAALKVLLTRHDFSLILMDVQMPDMNGLETATIIYERDKLKGIPIIFITAYSNDEEYIFKGYKMGAVDYIYKPINPELLRAKVSVFVELYRKNEQLLSHEKRLLAANKSLQKQIEEGKRSQEKINLLNKQLIENNLHLKMVNEELDQFAYVASHDLQEPLRKIRVFSDKITTIKNDDKEVEKYLAKISRSSERMQLLINNLLHFSRHSVNTADFVKVDLYQLVKEVINELDVDIERSNTRINLDQLPVIRAVPELMRQLFYNLINNAIKFQRKDRQPVIKICLENIDVGNSQINEKYMSGVPYYKISVSDNGIGFDAKYAEEIFMVFKRLHSYHEYEGTGIGLSICKKIVDKHNGYLTAFGNLNEGATFVIELPETSGVPQT